MALWQWLLGAFIVVGLFVALFWLDRFCLWLEDRGWLYYRRKKPSSSAASAWVAMQQFIEPGVKHVVQIKQERRSEEDEEADKERVLANLLATLDGPYLWHPVEGWRVHDLAGNLVQRPRHQLNRHEGLPPGER